MKAITIGEAEGQLGQLIDAAHRGELIVITNGSKQVALEPSPSLNLDEDSLELETELLKAAQQPFTRYSSTEMRAACERLIEEKRHAVHH